MGENDKSGCLWRKAGTSSVLWIEEATEGKSDELFMACRTAGRVRKVLLLNVVDRVVLSC